MLVDTGPLVAALNRHDAQHQTCRKLLDARAEALVVTSYVIAEGVLDGVLPDRCYRGGQRDGRGGRW